MQSKRNKTTVQATLANTNASSTANEHLQKDDSCPDDDFDMSNEDALVRLDQEVSLPKSKFLLKSLSHLDATNLRKTARRS